MIEPSPQDERRATQESERLAKINRAGPTWRMLVEVFGDDSLWVLTRPFKLLVRGQVNPDGTVYPKGEVRFKICRPDLSPEMNHRRLRVFNEMMRDRRLMQTENIQRRDEETEHVRWVDSDGVGRIAPAEHEDMLRKRDEERRKP